jgi:internalin A
LRNLRTIDLSRNHIDNDVAAFWMLPSLKAAILSDASLPGVPVEILSKGYSDNCLDRLQAHFADLTGDDAAVGDVKLMILGNGRVGKTQICRRLRGESFDEEVPSTHGIRVSSVPLAPHVPVMLKVWDFGGQDIYHGTHALFLRPSTTDHKLLLVGPKSGRGIGLLGVCAGERVQERLGRHLIVRKRTRAPRTGS